MAPEVSGASISALTRFSRYLGCSNNDFNPLIVIGLRIW